MAAVLVVKKAVCVGTEGWIIRLEVWEVVDCYPAKILLEQ